MTIKLLCRLENDISDKNFDSLISISTSSISDKEIIYQNKKISEEYPSCFEFELIIDYDNMLELLQIISNLSYWITGYSYDENKEDDYNDECCNCSLNELEILSILN
jgi:hypothetical protein